MNTHIRFGALEGLTGILAIQELKTALAVCSGLSNKEIAKEFGCAAGTVKKTLERIFFKFKVCSRSALVAKAFYLGLVTLTKTPLPDPQRPASEHDGVFIA